MRRTVVVVALLAVLSPGLGAAEPALTVGKTLRLATVRPREDSTGATPAPVIREDANCVTLTGAPGEGPITWTKQDRWLIGRLVAADDRRLMVQVAGGTDCVAVRRDDIASVAVRSCRSRGRGALVGAGVGAGLGAVMGLASGDDPPGFFALKAT